MSKPKAATAVAEPYKPKPAEAPALLAYRNRQARRPSARIKVTKSEKGCVVGPDHPDVAVGSAILMNALGTEHRFHGGLSADHERGKPRRERPSETEINFTLSVVNGIGPRDEVEAMLARRWRRSRWPQ